MRKVLTELMKWSRTGKPTDVDQLTRMLRRFAVERQQVPKDLAELVASNYLDSIPKPPAGLKYVIDRKRVEVRLE